MDEEDEIAVTDDTALTAEGYFAQASMDELRRYVCLDMARLLGVMPERAIRLAREAERFLLGRSLRPADDHD